VVPDAAQRIVSFLPGATELAFALGVGERLLAVSHECDHPPAARLRRQVVRPVLPVATMTPAEIDAAVTQRLHDKLNLYEVDAAALRELQPDLVLTQDLCQVCAASGNETAQLLAGLPGPPRVLSMSPRSLDAIFACLLDLGAATGTVPRAETLVAAARTRLAQVAARTAGLAPPRVFCMEWLDPPYCCGHWVPEMIALAGGRDRLARRGTDSVRIAWDEVRLWAPEVLVVMPCGYDLAQATALAARLADYPGWDELPAVRAGRVHVVDANSYFARPALRVVEGTELLAHLFHPQHCDWTGPPDAFRRL
jgi:iron complex transport system substrate-binding protein